MRVFARYLLALVPGCCWSLSLLGQNPSPEQQPVLRVTTHLVQVNVIVTDKKGEPVADLKREDFILLDEGRPQEISLFTVESTRPPVAQPQVLPPNTFSNRLEYQTGIPTSVTVILLDGLNTQFSDQAYAKQQIIKFIEQIQPQDHVALYALGTNLRVLHDFTSDNQALLNALARHKGRIPSELQASEVEEPELARPQAVGGRGLQAALLAGGGPGLQAARSAAEQVNAFLSEADQTMADYYTVRRAEITLNALEAIARNLAQLPGRKNLVWVSGSFPYWIGLDALPTPQNMPRERRTFSQEIERAARVLNQANLAIYPVDARGLMVDPRFSAERRSLPQLDRLQSFNLSLDTMDALADRTGGRAFYNTNDLQGALRQAVDDSRVTYALGYYPAHGKWDGKFHKIKIQVKWEGLRVRHRRGYFAVPEESPDSKLRDLTLDQAVWSPLESTGVRMIARANPLSSTSVSVQCQLDPRDLTLQPHGDRWEGAVDLVLVQLSAEGRNLQGLSQTINLDLRRENYERVSRQGMIIFEKIDVVPGTSQLRIVARDEPSGATGSVTIPLARVLPKDEK